MSLNLKPTSISSCRLGYNIYRQPFFTHRLLSTHASPHVVDNDVVIVGGGPAGLALANALGSSSFVRKNLSITLVEGSDLNKIKTWSQSPGTFSNRVSSLTSASLSFLKETGAWGFMDEKRTCSIDGLNVWDGISDARLEFSAEDLSPEIPGSGMARLTENLNLQRAILRHLETIPEVRILQNTKVSSISRDEDRGGWPLVHLDNNVVLRARLLVGADGFNSPVRLYAGIPAFGWPYDAKGIVATMFHPPRGAYEGPNTTAYQRFLPTGPIAFLPLSPTRSSLVWSTKPDLAAALLSCDPAVLASMVNAAFRLPYISIKYLHRRILEGHAAGIFITPEEIQHEIHWREQSHGIDKNSAHASALIKSTDQLGIPPIGSESFPPLVTELQTGSVASFPLRYNHAESYIGDSQGARTVLVGDAAHTVHPLAGQGLNLGLADVECLTRCIHTSLRSGGDIGSYTALMPYGQERYLVNHSMMSAIDKLHKLYSNEMEPIVWARSVGIEVLNELDSVKAAIMTIAGAQTGVGKEAPARNFAWDFAGNAVQSFSDAGKAVEVLRGAVWNAVTSSIQSISASKDGSGLK